MKKQYSRLLEYGLKDEVDVKEEWNRLSSKIKEKEIGRMKANHAKQVSLTVLKYAAAVFLGFLVSSMILFWPEDDAVQLVVGTYKVHTERGERSFVELPDGSKVWLNTYTTLKYASDYGITNRNIYINGEAYFEVAKNKEIPFVVKTDDVDVTALGTSFNISAYSDDKELVTTLYSGKVSVKPALYEQEILLNPNQKAVYNKDYLKIEKISSENNALQWREGILSFDNMQLDEIVKLLERNYAINVRYENQRIKKLYFSGTFRSNESISDIVKVISANTSIGYLIKGDTIIFK